VLTFEQIKELIALIADNGLEGMEIERSGFKMKIDGRRTPAAVVSEVSSAPAAPVMAALPSAPAGAAQPAPADVQEAAAGTPDTAADGAARVTSPIVGTFYTAPNPDSPAYVRVGDRVEVGQVLCIVEAMKLMNEIESDVSGVVVEIFPKNAQPVEFGEPLFAVQSD